MITLEDARKEVEKQLTRDLAAGTAMQICIAGLAEEAGEVAGLYKRRLRNTGNDRIRCTRAAWVEELGDTLWYLLAVASLLDLDMDEIWNTNIRKLEERYGK